MKSFNTSLKKDNEGIVFMDFPGVVKPTKEKKNKHVFLIALIIILVCMLYVLSAMLNEKYLYGNSNYVFNVANKFDGDVAVINKKDRKGFKQKCSIRSNYLERLDLRMYLLDMRLEIVM